MLHQERHLESGVHSLLKNLSSLEGVAMKVIEERNLIGLAQAFRKGTADKARAASYDNMCISYHVLCLAIELRYCFPVPMSGTASSGRLPGRGSVRREWRTK